MANNYSLNTSFTDEDLKRFYASGSNVVVGKPNAGGVPNVAWIVYRPLISNRVTWDEKYGMYASNSDIINGAILSQMSQSEFPAVDGKLYTLAAQGSFSGPSSGGTPGSYSACNDYNNLPKGLLTFGLFQNANIDGTEVKGNAISAAPVPYKSIATITPFTTIYLWVQSQVQGNSVVTFVSGPMTEVTFGGTSTEISLQYDATTGRFVTKSGMALPAGTSLQHHELAVV